MLEVEVKFKKDGTVRKLRAVDREAVEEALAARGLTPDDVSLRTLRDSNKLRAEAAQLGATADSLVKVNSPGGEGLRIGFDGVKPVVRSGSVKKLAQGWLGDIFPTALERGSEYGPLDALLDMGGYPLRSAGALFDAANPYSTRTAESRFGVREGLEDSQKDRWGVDVPLLGQVSPGAMLHGTLHDQMTVPMAIPGAGVSRMIGPGQTLLGKVARGSLSGGVIGAMTEAARPAFTDTELDGDYLKNIMLGLGSGAALGGAALIAGKPVSYLGKKWEASIPRTREKLAGISKVRPEALEVASTGYGMDQLRKYYGKQGDIADELSGMYDRFNSEANFPEYRDFKTALEDAQGVADVYPVGEGARNFRADMLRETESPELMTSTEAAANRLERNARHYDPAARADQGALSRIMLGDGAELVTGGFSPSVDGSPVSLRGAKAIQRSKQIVQSDLASEYNKAQLGQTDLETAIMKQQARDLRKLLDGILSSEGTATAERGREALASMARKNRALEKAQKMLVLGKDLDLMPNRAEGAIKGLFQENSSRNARRQGALRGVDDAFDTDILGRSRYASLAANLAEPGAAVGGDFNLASTNKHLTGRSLLGLTKLPFVGGILADLAGQTPRGAVRRLRGTQFLAEGLQNLGELGPTGIAMRDLSLLTNGGPKTPTLSDFMQNSGSPYYSPFYERPASQPASNEQAEKKKKEETELARTVSMLVNGGAQAIGLAGPTYKAKSVADLR